MRRIACFHLYNDYSGSPKVLAMILEGLLKRKYDIELLSSGKGGSLDILENYSNLVFRRYKYKFSENKIIEICRYTFVQIFVFLYAFRYLFKRDTIFYINTLLPVGAAFAGWITRKHIVYHYHENANAKGGIYRILSVLMQFFADDIICVSEYQASFLKRKDKVVVIPNVLDEKFTKNFEDIYQYDNFDKKNVLMLASLKSYKGIKEFVELAKNIPDYSFTLVINDETDNIEAYFKLNQLNKPENLNVFPRQFNVVPFYRNASVVLNLSNKNIVIETFGLTVLEAFTAGLPVIVPTVGGIAELVDDDVDGYKIDVEDIDKIALKIREMLSDKDKYSELRKNAIEKSRLYNYSMMIDNIERIIRK